MEGYLRQVSQADRAVVVQVQELVLPVGGRIGRCAVPPVERRGILVRLVPPTDTPTPTDTPVPPTHTPTPTPGVPCADINGDGR